MTWQHHEVRLSSKFFDEAQRSQCCHRVAVDTVGLLPIEKIYAVRCVSSQKVRGDRTVAVVSVDDKGDVAWHVAGSGDGNDFAIRGYLA